MPKCTYNKNRAFRVGIRGKKKKTDHVVLRKVKTIRRPSFQLIQISQKLKCFPSPRIFGADEKSGYGEEISPTNCKDNDLVQVVSNGGFIEKDRRGEANIFQRRSGGISEGQQRCKQLDAVSGTLQGSSILLRCGLHRGSELATRLSKKDRCMQEENR